MGMQQERQREGGEGGEGERERGEDEVVDGKGEPAGTYRPCASEGGHFNRWAFWRELDSEAEQTPDG
eukprot:761404-Hanusia_phi.AAC.6